MGVCGRVVMGGGVGGGVGLAGHVGGDVHGGGWVWRKLEKRWEQQCHRITLCELCV